MDPAQIEMLVQRLIADPEDGEALQLAYQAGTQDPTAYAGLLERVGQGSTDPVFSAHWFSEASNVWESLGEMAQRNRLLAMAADRDPSNAPAVEKVAQLYRDAGDPNRLAQLLERMCEAVPAILDDQPEYRSHLVAAHEELGRLYSEGPLQNADAAARHWTRLSDFDPQNQYAIYTARELYKSMGRWAEALPLFAKEIALVGDAERKVALLRDEAEVRRNQGDLAGLTATLRQAHQVRPDDPGITYEFAYSVVERIKQGQPVGPPERAEAAQALVGLAEMYDGEHAMMYAQAALDAEPGDDRAMQLADYHAQAMGRQQELVPSYTAYLQASPQGYMAEGARQQLTAMGQPLPGIASSPPSQQYGSQHPPQPQHGSQPPPHSLSQQGSQQPPAEHVAHGSAPAPGSAPAQASAAPQPSEPAGYPSAPAQPGGYPSAPHPHQGGYPSVPSEPAQPPPPAEPAPPPEPQVDPNSIEGLLMEAEKQASGGNKPRAYDAYRAVLEQQPDHPDALSWVEDFLEQRRKFADLRDVLLAASAAPGATDEARLQRLREVAKLCEDKLRDFDGAIDAYKAIYDADDSDEDVRDQLVELLEKQRRWDELAAMLEQQAVHEVDLEQKVLLEKQLAKLHEKRRDDPFAAAEAWTRIVELQPGVLESVMTAVGLYEKAERIDAAAGVLTAALPTIDDRDDKGEVLDKLGEVRQALGDPGAAADAYGEAGELLDSDAHFERAVTAYEAAQRYGDAALMAERRSQLHEGKDKAAHLAKAGELLLQAGNADGALEQLEVASELDPENDQLATRVEEQHHQAGRHDEQVQFLLRRAGRLEDVDMRVGIRHRAAAIQRSIGDEDGARQSLELVLEDKDDVSAMQLLLEMAERRQDWSETVRVLERLVANTDGESRLAYAVREAQVLADGVNDVDAAVDRYQKILDDYDPKNAYSMHAMADLQMRRGDHEGAAEALEKLLEQSEGEQRIETARQLAQLYEGVLDDVDNAIRVLDIVHKGDEQDFDAIARLQRLAEKKEDWPRVTTLLAKLIEVEGDEEEASEMTRQLAELYYDKMSKGDQALAALEKRADEGDVACQQRYADLGIELDWKGVVAQKLVQWNESVAGTSRSDALRRAFDLFLEVERDADAKTVALALARSKDCDVEMARELEAVAVRTKDLDALGVAHDIIGKSLGGLDRAEEYVRQAEVMHGAGADGLDAIQHGELALSGIDPPDAQPLLTRLAALTEAPGHVIDLHERQVQRCKKPQDRVAALAAAAQVAAERGAVDRAREFFNVALSGGVNEDTLTQLEDAARAADQAAGGTGKLLRTMAEALAEGGQGSRDGGRTRSALLRRAAVIAHRELSDMDAAFNWLGDSLIAHVDDAALAALDDLAEEVGDPSRVEQALTRALEEVHDGPLVRRLLRRRADLRKDGKDLQEAASDLKKLHDLSPADQDLTKELSDMLTRLGDHRGMIELYEDQILRGREPHVRAELARKVARIWEEQIGDARETADAWRRVLRMKAGDKEAQAGLDRAKSGKLKMPPPVRGKSSPPTSDSLASKPPASKPPPPPPRHSKPPSSAPAEGEASPPSSPATPPPLIQPPAMVEPVVEGATDQEVTSPDAVPPVAEDPSFDTAPDVPPEHIQAAAEALAARESGEVPSSSGALPGAGDGVASAPDATQDQQQAYDQQGYDAQPQAYDQQGYDADAQPGYDQQQPGYDQQQPGQAGYDPQQAGQAGYDPQQAGYDEQQGSGHPQQPGYDPQQAGYDPQQAGYDQQQQGYDQQAYDQQQAYYAQQQAYAAQQQSGYDSQQPQAYDQQAYEQQQQAYAQQQGQQEGYDQQAYDQQQAYYAQQQAYAAQQQGYDPQQQQAYDQQAYDQQQAYYAQQQAYAQQQGHPHDASQPAAVDGEEAIDLDDSAVELVEDDNDGS